VLLLEAGAEAPSDAGAATLTQTSVLDESFAYLRVGAVGKGLADKIKAAMQGLQANNKIKGLALDLRFASGGDYAAAVQVADLFLSKEKTLLTWNDQSAKSTDKTDSIRIPAVVVVNAQTKGAAEALAALFRNQGIGLLIGSTTAGQATVFKDFTLNNGQTLRVATTQIRLGDGQELSLRGIIPDIEVSISASDEKEYFRDSFLVLTNKASVSLRDKSTDTAATNRLSRHRVNEAELVRAQKEGINPEEDIPASVPKESEPLKSIVRDPVLARALDLLKGLTVIKTIGRP
jgi:C-terminal processing protease CtpA/Prc